eukprot:m.481376 g.481376  ORF g.481376 m.481376 type:complete len:270 (+) comp21716_c2_seq4:411-1220(+)
MSEPFYENVDVPTQKEPTPPLPPRGAAPSTRKAAPPSVSSDATLYADLDIGAMILKEGATSKDAKPVRDSYSTPNLAPKSDATGDSDVVYATIAIPGKPENAPNLWSMERCSCANRAHHRCADVIQPAYSNFDPANGIEPKGSVAPPDVPKKQATNEPRRPAPAVPTSKEAVSKDDNSLVAFGVWHNDSGDIAVRIRHHHPFITVTDMKTNKVVYSWQTNTLRSFGQQGKTFVFEAGRRSVSGEGKFRFKLDNDVPLALSLRNCQMQKQ